MKILQDIPAGRGSRLCTGVDRDRIMQAIPDMLAACFVPLSAHTEGAVAIAHCQVDQEDPLRFFVHRDGYAVLNPVIHRRMGQPFKYREGCMSFAARGLRLVDRYRTVEASFQVLRKDGKTEDFARVRLDGQLAIVFQHEVDHMNGRHIFNAPAAPAVEDDGIPRAFIPDTHIHPSIWGAVPRPDVCFICAYHEPSK